MAKPDTFGKLNVEIGADAEGFKTELADAAKLGNKLGSSLATAFEGIAFKGKSLGETLSKLTLSISQMVLAASFKPLGQDLVSGIGGLFGGGEFGFGGGFGATPLPVPFAKGGVIASPTTFPLGNGAGLAGERGAEAIMPLARGPDGRLGVASNAGAAPTITINIQATDVESFRRSETQIAALLARTVAQGQRNL